MMSTSDVIANINKCFASAELDIKKASSKDDNIRCRNRIQWLAEFKKKVLEEDHKRAVENQKELNSWFLEDVTVTKGDSDDGVVECVTADPACKGKDVNTVPFMALPFGVRNSLFEKFNYPQFTLFDECCQFSHDLCQKTKHKFVLEHITSGEFTNYRWKFGPRPFVRLDVLKAEDLKKVYFKFKDCLAIQERLTDNLCLLFMSQVKTETISLESSFECSQENWSQLIQTLGVNVLHVDLNNSLEEFPYDTSKISKVSIVNARKLSLECILKLKAKTEIYFERMLVENIQLKIEAMMNYDRYETSFWAPTLDAEVVTEIIESFGDRAQLTAGTKNCWSITDGISDKHRLILVFKNKFHILPPDLFLKSFGNYAEFR